MRFEANWLILGAAVAGASACAPVDPGFGDSLKYDQAIQTINPDPVYPPGSALPGSNGAAAAAAAARYRQGAVKPVERISSSSSSSSSGSSGGSGPK